MTGLGKMPEKGPKRAKFGFSSYNFEMEGPRDLKFGLLASSGEALPLPRIKNRVPVSLVPPISLLPLCPESSENIPILFQGVDLHFSNQNDPRNPKMGSKQSVTDVTEWVFFHITCNGTKNHHKIRRFNF